MITVENLSSHTLPPLVSWFNGQSEDARTVKTPVKYYKVRLYRRAGELVPVVTDELTDALFVGQSVFVFTGAVGIPVLVGESDFFEVSSYVVPQPTDVVAAINAWSEEQESAEVPVNG